jgi:hypothetical protein
LQKTNFKASLCSLTYFFGFFWIFFEFSLRKKVLSIVSGPKSPSEGKFRAIFLAIFLKIPNFKGLWSFPQLTLILGMLKLNKGRVPFFLSPPARHSTGGVNLMTKLEKVVIIFSILSLGWFLGRFTEAWVLGNLGF